mgnify:CR=1 FL=1
MYVIETQEISRTFSRGRVKALSGMSLNVKKGVIFGLLGPNGAGKTTFIKILLSVLRAEKGVAKLFGLPVENHLSRQSVGYLPENHRFPEFLTGGALIDYSARLSGMENAAERLQRAEILLNRVKMWQWRDTKIKKYSKGMIQRLGLAQAMMHEPKLLFLDEPTDGVDPIGRREIRDLLLELKAGGATIFLNSHLLSEVEMICDEVAILDKGRLLKHGTVDELTVQKKRYMVQAKISDESLKSAITQKVESLSQENGYLDVTVENVTQLNSVIDLLRQSDVLIEAVTPFRQTLEDSFVQTIQSEELTDFTSILSKPQEGGE